VELQPVANNDTNTTKTKDILKKRFINNGINKLNYFHSDLLLFNNDFFRKQR